MYFLPELNSRALRILLLLLAVVATANAQSLDITAPSPVRTNQTVGTIAARDLGDSRLTNHYYIFAATLGDLIVTVETSNLNGDIDIFTAGSLRPLLKFTIYAESSSPISKTVFMRNREELILRVQARSPNDDQGTYHIRFGGTFEPVTGGSLLTEGEKEAEVLAEEKPLTAAVDPKVRRVSSVGARIEEPEPPPSEVAEATPEPTPEVLPTPETKPSDAVTETTEATTATSERRRQSSRRRGARPPAASAAPVVVAAEPKEESKPDPKPIEEVKEEAKADPKPAEEVKEEAKAEPKPGEEIEVAPVGEEPAKAEAEPPKPPSRSVGRRGRTPQPVAEPDPEPPVGPRLIIETRDGVRIERYMSTIRRVTVERNQIVVVGRDGKIERTMLSDVVRMSIEP